MRGVSGAATDVVETLSREPGRHPLVWVLGAAGTGICLDRFTPISLCDWCVLTGVALVTFLWLYRRMHSGWSSLWLLVLIAAVTGLWHYDRWRLFASHEIARVAGDAPIPVAVRVKVRDAPRDSPAAHDGPLSTMTRGETTRIEVRIVALRRANAWQAASGRATMIVEGRYEGVYRGDLLEVAALLARVRPPLNPGEPDFAALCRGRRQLTVLLCEHTECVNRLARGSPFNPLRQLGRVRLWAEWTLDRYIGVRRSPLAAALLLGTRGRLDQSTIDTFFHSGTLHLLAISGFHVGVLATAFWLLIRLDWLPRRPALLAICLLAIAYALLTGSRPPVVRATILVVVTCLARSLGRPAVAWNSWAAAGIITLVWSPAGLFDTGTQLSFLAVAAVIGAWRLVTPHRPRDPLERLIITSRPIVWRAAHTGLGCLGRLLLLSALVWSVSLPLVAYRFHLVAPVGILLNVLLSIPVAIALYMSLLVLLTAWLPWVPRLCGMVCDVVLSGVEWSTNSAAHWSAGHFWAVGPPWWWLVGFYGGLVFEQFSPWRIPPRWRWALLAGWMVVAICCGSSARRLWRQQTRPPLYISFVAVGHGACVLVELPGGETILYDAGRMGSPRAAALPISSLLWSRGLSHLDAIILSHADADHFNAVPVLVERFSVGVVYVSPDMFRAPGTRSDRAARRTQLRTTYRSARCTKEIAWRPEIRWLSPCCTHRRFVATPIPTGETTPAALCCSWHMGRSGFC